MRGQETAMTPTAIRALREHLHLTQEVFASILGVSFATVNRWENSKTVPTGDYARILQTLQQLTAHDVQEPAIDWQRVGALSAMAAVAGFSPLLTLGAALAPLLIARLPSWADVPLAEASPGRPRPRLQGKNPAGRKRVSPQPSPTTARKGQAKAEASHQRAIEPRRAHTQRTGG